MILERFVVGPFQCNCNVLACEKTQEAIVLDPGDEPEKIVAYLKRQNLKVKYLLHTHAHLDHVGGTCGVQEHSGGEACLHEGDRFLFENLPMQAALFNLPPPPQGKIDQWIADQDMFAFGNYKLQALHTPGHTPGSMSFLLEDEAGDQLFSGDTLFARSIGRTDLWGGDYQQIIRSIRNKLLPLDEKTVIHAGHGPDSTIGEEKMGNPFLQS